MIEGTCRVCGCTESNACPQGCSWIELDELTGEGLCSSCAPAPDVFDVCRGCRALIYVLRDAWIFLEDGGRILDLACCSLGCLERWAQQSGSFGWPLHVVDGQVEEHTT